MSGTCLMKELHEDDLIWDLDVYFKYSNIVKNSKRKDPWGSFHIKKYDEDGNSIGEYYSTNDGIFREKKIRPYTLKFNPEKLI